jgi:hypothetical protein
VAAELVGGYPEGRIRAKLDAFDWLLARGDKRVAKSPAGYLVGSIRDDYAAPKGFASDADRTRRREAEEVQGRGLAESRRRLAAEERALQEAQQARIAAYWDVLSPAERKALEARALAGSHPLLGLYRRHQGQGTPAERRYRKLILDAHILELLGDG